jgi:hypothetical protein
MPKDVKVTGWVAVVFKATPPNATVVELILRIAVAACNCTTKLFEALPWLAVSVTVWAGPLYDTVAMNPALVAFAGTVTFAGSVTAELLLDKLTLIPPLGAAALSVTVQASVPDSDMVALLQEKVLSAAVTVSGVLVVAVVPVPLRLMTVVPSVEELLAMVSCPVAAPVTVGSNCTLSVTA